MKKRKREKKKKGKEEKGEKKKKRKEEKEKKKNRGKEEKGKRKKGENVWWGLSPQSPYPNGAPDKKDFFVGELL